MSGREYKIKTWDDDAGKEVEIPFFVRDDVWVLEVSSSFHSSTEWDVDGWTHNESSSRAFEVVEGLAPVHELTLVCRHQSGGGGDSNWSSGSRTALLVSREPFGAISWSEEDGKLSSGKYFRPARQVHRGELGRFPAISTPRWAREAPPETSEFTSKRDRKRSHIGWVRLIDVSVMTGLSMEEMILRYWPFVDGREFETKLDLVVGEWGQIHKQVPTDEMRRRLTRAEVEAMFVSYDVKLSKLWIRRGLARTILMLHKFGYVPTMEAKTSIAA